MRTECTFEGTTRQRTLHSHAVTISNDLFRDARDFSRAPLVLVFLAILTASIIAAAQTAYSSAGEAQGIEVRAVDPNGAFIPNAQITIQNTNSYIAHGRTDGAGLFSLSDVAPGEYRIVVECRGFTTGTTAIRVGKNSIATIMVHLEVANEVIRDDFPGTVVNVEPITSNLDSEVLSEKTNHGLSPQKTIVDFIVLDPSGVGIPGATVSVYDRKKKLSKGRTAARGVLSISGLPEGTYSFAVKCPGFPKYKGTILVVPGEPASVNVMLKLAHSEPVTSVE